MLDSRSSGLSLNDIWAALKAFGSIDNTSSTETILRSSSERSIGIDKNIEQTSNNSIDQYTDTSSPASQNHLTVSACRRRLLKHREENVPFASKQFDDIVSFNEINSSGKLEHMMQPLVISSGGSTFDEEDKTIQLSSSISSTIISHRAPALQVDFRNSDQNFFDDGINDILEIEDNQHQHHQCEIVKQKSQVDKFNYNNKNNASNHNKINNNCLNSVASRKGSGLVASKVSQTLETSTENIRGTFSGTSSLQVQDIYENKKSDIFHFRDIPVTLKRSGKTSVKLLCDSTSFESPLNESSLPQKNNFKDSQSSSSSEFCNIDMEASDELENSFHRLRKDGLSDERMSYNSSLSSSFTIDYSPRKESMAEILSNRKLKLSDFKLFATLGTGTFGRVRLAKLKRCNEDVPLALKCMKKKEMIRLKQVEHVKSENKILKQISHPFIVNLYTSFQDYKKLYMVMEFVYGGELFSLLQRVKSLENNSAKFYAAEITLAFEYLHMKKIAYRDLKPENILIDKDGHIKLTDFGFAKVVENRTWTMCGTPEYLAPEVIQSKGHGVSVDWWALGVLIYEMICGCPPFYSDSPFGIYQKILAGVISFPKNIDMRAKDLIKRLLTPDRARRLGCLKSGAKDIKDHKWFRSTDWAACINKALKPPFIPNPPKSSFDTSMYDNYPESRTDCMDGDHGIILNDEEKQEKVEKTFNFLVKLLETLEEKNIELFERIVCFCGEKQCIEIQEECIESLKQGGLQTLDKKKNRSKGGTFIFHLRKKLTKEDYKKIWQIQNERQKERKKENKPCTEIDKIISQVRKSARRKRGFEDLSCEKSIEVEEGEINNFSHKKTSRITE